MNKKQARRITEAVLKDLGGRKGLDHEFDAIHPAVMTELKASLDDTIIASSHGLMTEQEHSNQCVRLLRDNGTCPICGAEDDPARSRL